MNTGQKIVLALGLLGIAVTGLVPPWSVSCTLLKDSPPARRLEYALLFDPPTGDRSQLCSVSLDVSVLLTVWVVVIAIAVALALLLWRRRTS